MVLTNDFMTYEVSIGCLKLLRQKWILFLEVFQFPCICFVLFSEDGKIFSICSPLTGGGRDTIYLINY